MNTHDFVPHHINATAADLAGNNGIGRYIIMPGSDGRAREIAEHFDNQTVKAHPRGHNLYLGTLKAGDKSIDVASISSGMGCPSMEIILHELHQLGAKRFLRVGTAGSLQGNIVKLGDIVCAQASVRDESSTADYMPHAVPALASIEMINAINAAAKKQGLTDRIHTGMAHCKSTLYAREFGIGPKALENQAYMQLLQRCGVLATEMETAALFTQSHLYNFALMQQGNQPQHRVLAGAILSIIAVPPNHFEISDIVTQVIKDAIALALETVRTLALQEC